MKKKQSITILNLSTGSLTNLDRVVALQCATALASHFGLSEDRKDLEPLIIAFGNGVAYARQTADPEVRRQLEDFYRPLNAELFPSEN